MPCTEEGHSFTLAEFGARVYGTSPDLGEIFRTTLANFAPRGSWPKGRKGKGLGLAVRDAQTATWAAS